MSNLSKTTLANGVRVLVEPVDHVRSAAIGVWCHTGSSHEFDNEGGITHLIEHMLFKGTSKRSAFDIAEAIEGRGGHLNAFTDKEMTCYYCRVLADDVAVGLDVLTDMVMDASLDPDELDLEKGVVLEEIKRSEDEPSDLVHDLHLSALWPEHELGRPIIGTAESVSSFAREDIQRYMARRYQGGNLLVSVAGRVEPAQIADLVDQALWRATVGAAPLLDTRPSAKPTTNLVGKPVEQVHFCIGGEAVAVRDDELPVAVVLDGVLGSGMSSRLFQEIREKRGLAYSVGSYNQFYRTAGTFTVYGGTSPDRWPEVQRLVREEFDRISTEPVPEEEIERVKRNLKGSAVLALEGMSSRMIRMAKNELVFGREVELDEWLAKIDAVTASALCSLAARVLHADRVATTAIGPFGD